MGVEQIRELVKRSIDIEFALSCLTVLDDRLIASGETIYQASATTLDLTWARELYHRRGEMNGPNGPLKGYGNLLLHLEQASSPISIQSIQTPSDYFILFTDPDLSQLYGILWNQSGHVYDYYRQYSPRG